MPNSDQLTIQLPYLQDQKSLTLHWRWFSEWDIDHVAVFFFYQSSQYIGHA